MDCLAKVKRNLLPLSQEKGDVLKALTEWEYRGINYDLSYADEICQLCDHDNIRFQFEIVNKYNENSLLIGSQCIRRYDGITVLDLEGNSLTGEAATKKLNGDRRKLITDAKKNSVLMSLVKLSRIKSERSNFERTS